MSIDIKDPGDKSPYLADYLRKALRAASLPDASVFSRVMGVNSVGEMVAVSTYSKEETDDQLLDVGGRISAVEANMVSGRATYETWAALSAVTGSDGDGAEVVPSDSGTHTDPVVGGTVANYGLFIWSDLASGWKRIDDGLAAKANQAALAALVSSGDPGIETDDALVLSDDLGHVAARIKADGGIATRRVQLGLPDDDGSFGLVDDLGFVGLSFSQAGGLRIQGRPVMDWISAKYNSTGIYLPDVPCLSKWRYALAGVMQGARPAKIAFVGDSNTAGYYSESPSASLRQHAHPEALTRLLDPVYGARSTCFFGKANGVEAYGSYNPDVTLGSGWTFSANTSLGGEMFINTTTTDALTFDPGIDWDTAEIYVALSVAGSFSLDIGGSVTNYTPATGSIQKITYTPGLGANALNIKRISGTVELIGCMLSDSTKPEINVLNIARGGWRALNWEVATSFYSPLNALNALGADLHFIELGLNEMANNNTPASFAASMQKVIDGCLSNGDVVLVSSVTPVSAYTYPWADYVAAMHDLAVVNRLPFLDLSKRFGDRATVEAIGFNSDAIHPNKYGYGDKAKAIADFLATI